MNDQHFLHVFCFFIKQQISRLRIVGRQPCLEDADASIINVDKVRLAIEKESLQLNCVVASTKTMLKLLVRIVVMLEHRRWETAPLDPLPRPILAWWSPSDFNPSSLRMHPADDGIVNGCLCWLYVMCLFVTCLFI